MASKVPRQLPTCGLHKLCVCEGTSSSSASSLFTPCVLPHFLAASDGNLLRCFEPLGKGERRLE
ncbi:hypothetical protein CIPAW_02G126500 [Carya illinoinensis]|uniref:Uncharacterized protein n=1 Tax=Carya illinoinensis TaxID=32201 RepID=A0A8T1RBR3_CARIL|nr:hypothetical protein CIPAW_02G126500 [Carya illinoinensis]